MNAPKPFPASSGWRRSLRHLWMDTADSHQLLTASACERLEAAVRASEAMHLGELRLCVEASLPWSALRQGQDARQRAIDLFGQLRVWDTAHNNGVLIYLLLADRRIEVLADRGLHAHAPEPVWAQLASDLADAMGQGQIEAGLNLAVQRVSDLLKQHHPAPQGVPRRNELPDAVILL
ncbi:MAG: hypothetical protein RI920_914 [Pseudomonadota bacterium]